MSSTTATLPKMGTVLQNGAVALAFGESKNSTADMIVLAYWPRTTEFVTWAVNSKLECCWGHYHKDVNIAINDYEERLK